MLISHSVEGIRSDLVSLGHLGGEEFVATAERLAVAAEPAIRARLLEALSQVVAEVNESAPDLVLELRLAGDDVTLVRREATVEVPEAPAELSARFALRLPEELKVLIEERASRAGASANSYIVRALSKEMSSSESRATARVGRTLRGSGQS